MTGPAEILHSSLKLFSMFKIRICYDSINVQKNVPDAMVIICINCGKTGSCTLNSKPLEDFITVFVTNVLFPNILYLRYPGQKNN